VEERRLDSPGTGVVCWVGLKLCRVMGFPLVWGNEGGLGGFGALVEGAPKFGGLGSEEIE
jgi:hypothetical protein